MLSLHKQVGMFTMKYNIKFIMRNIVDVTGNQLVKHVKKITYIFKKNLHVPNYKCGLRKGKNPINAF